MTWQTHSLTIGLPQTNYRNLAEARLLMEAGNFFWWSLGHAIGRPVSQLRSPVGDPLYATIFFLEEIYPPERTLSTFRLDDQLRFAVGLRAISTLSVEGRVIFDQQERLAEGADWEALWRATPPAHPTILFGSLFGTPAADNHQLKLSVPGNASLKSLPHVPLEDNTSQLARLAQRSGQLDLIGVEWMTLDPAPREISYAIDPDRDTNAAGLIYFANFVSLLESGERQAIASPVAGGSDTRSYDPSTRQLAHRRIAYYGNAGLSDQLLISVQRCVLPGAPQQLGVRSRISRQGDGQLICLSEAMFLMGPVAPTTSPAAHAQISAR